MDALQVSIACLLLKMTFDPTTAQFLKPRGCPTCEEGYFMMTNCSLNYVKTGIQCKLCTNCSASDQDTLVECSTFADSLCGNKTATVVTLTQPPAELQVSSAPRVWIIHTVIVIFLILILLPSLFLILLSCRNQQRNKLKGLDLL